ncbi:MAG: hypothetical protein IJ150_09925 [Bacteroidales bacterium]|nr:hypothetical protein [Bacteroidales bacterium]
MLSRLQPNYQYLSNGEKSILYTISLLPPRMYSAKDIFNVFDLNYKSDESVKFFDTLHDLTKKGWLTFSQGMYQLTEVKKKLLYSFRQPDQHYFRNLVEKVTKFFSKDNNISQVSKEFIENQEQVAANILKWNLRPTKQIAVLAQNFSNYWKRKKVLCLALKYSKMAVDTQFLAGGSDEDLCFYLSQRAALLFSLKQYKEAVCDAMECLDICGEKLEKRKYYFSKQLSLSILSASYEKIGNSEASLKYAEKALELSKKHKMSANLKNWLSYYNVGVSSFKRGEFSKAWFHIVKAYAEYCDENSKKPAFISQLNFRRNFYEFWYRVSRLLGLKKVFK